MYEESSSCAYGHFNHSQNITCGPGGCRSTDFKSIEKIYCDDYNSCGYCHFTNIGYDGVYCSGANACSSPSGDVYLCDYYATFICRFNKTCGYVHDDWGMVMRELRLTLLTAADDEFT